MTKTGTAETYSNEGPECPHCGRQYTADEPFYYDERLCTEMECDVCGKTFDIEVHHSVYWECIQRDEEVSLSGDLHQSAPAQSATQNYAEGELSSDAALAGADTAKSGETGK